MNITEPPKGTWWLKKYGIGGHKELKCFARAW